MKKDYTIGLDIGTNSVGWAVLYDNYDLVKRKISVYGNTEKKYSKKNFWGVRLFDEGKTAQDRRLKRTARRRYLRRKYRLNALQTIFFQAMSETDQEFFNRLNESFLVLEDKKYERHPIFASLEEEKNYHEKFPTIYHLRKYLADTKEKADLRLVYLAIAHIIKFRGHFLIQGKLNIVNSSPVITFQNFLASYNRVFSKDGGSSLDLLDEQADLEAVFGQKVSRLKKVELILTHFPGEKSNGVFAQFIKMIAGNQANFKAAFALEEDAKLQFSKEEYDENLEELLAKIGDEYADVFTDAQKVYDAAELSNILESADSQTKAKLSAGMVERYEEHRRDLTLFKNFIRENIPEKYDKIFKDVTVKGYAGYIENANKVKQEEFYKYIKNSIEKITEAEYFIKKIDQETFLRKQRSFENGVIPHQVHLQELEAIIAAQQIYYPFLAENAEKIKKLLNFRIPYYVGPLGHKEDKKFAWLTRKESGPITPWNIEEKVSFEQSAVSFIDKMLNADTYLPDKKVLPKHSMIYEKYTVYNELTKVSYIDEQGRTQNFSSVEKNKIFDCLFKKKRSVTKKLLEEFLRDEYLLEDVEIQGVDMKFNSSYGTYQDFKKIGIDAAMLDDTANESMFEEIVQLLTIFEDRKMIHEQLEKFSDRIPADALKKLERRHYTGWGRFSSELLNEMRDRTTNKTILDFLINDDGTYKNINRNLMQLINDDDLSFKTSIAKRQQKNSIDRLEDVVRSLAGSPAIKKGILQSLKIVEELEKVMGYAPKKIVVEMARENQTTGRGRANSRSRMRTLEKAIKELNSNILKEYPTDNNQLQNDRLYLYYLQNGKDMYTGDPLDINNLSNYDIDHIIPQSFITDNSIDNRVLVSSKMNRGKSADVPSASVVQRMSGFWYSLYNSNLISKRKLENLTKAERGGLTDDDKAGFIKRQLVETRQITKNVAQILDQKYNTQKDANGETIKEVQVITLKAALTSQFRQIYGIHKVREINDYHHAHDAYLNGVVANALLKVYPRLEPELVYGEFRRFNTHRENKATAKKDFYSNVMKFFKDTQPKVDENGEILWDQKNISTIKKVINYRQMNIVKKPEIQKGGFSKESILKKGESDSLFPRKTKDAFWDPKKYGGFDSPVTAYTVIIRHEKGKKKKITKKLVGITIIQQAAFERDPLQFLEAKGYSHPLVLGKLPKYSLVELENGRRRLVASAKELQKGNQIVLPQKLVDLLYHSKKIADSQASLKYVKEHVSDYQELLELIINISNSWILAKEKIALILKLYEENKDGEVEAIAASFVELMKLTAFGAPAKFKFFGIEISRNRYNSSSEILNGIFIYQSITGLYETRIKLED